jgi:FO synthase subunit 2
MEVLKIHAISRIMLNNWIPNIQVSWVKEGPRLSEILLQAGVNDLGGSLINESISTAAGANHGQLIRPSEFRRIIREVGRKPAERYTSYKIRRIFEANDDPIDPLDQLPESPEKYFGTYNELIKLETYRYKHPKVSQVNSSSIND